MLLDALAHDILEGDLRTQDVSGPLGEDALVVFVDDLLRMVSRADVRYCESGIINEYIRISTCLW